MKRRAFLVGAAAVSVVPALPAVPPATALQSLPSAVLQPSFCIVAGQVFWIGADQQIYWLPGEKELLA